MAPTRRYLSLFPYCDPMIQECGMTSLEIEARRATRSLVHLLGSLFADQILSEAFGFGSKTLSPEFDNMRHVARFLPLKLCFFSTDEQFHQPEQQHDEQMDGSTDQSSGMMSRWTDQLTRVAANHKTEMHCARTFHCVFEVVRGVSTCVTD